MDKSIQLVKAKNGDERALGEALESVRGYLLKVAERDIDPALVGKIGASDAVQETFLEARRRFGTFRGNSPAEWRAWLLTVLRHRLTKLRRSYIGTEKRRVGREQRLRSENRGPNLATRSGSTPSQVAMRDELRDVLRIALSRLPAHYQDVVRWRHEERLSFEEVAARLETSPEGARKVWGRAMVRLKEEIGAGYDPH